MVVERLNEDGACGGVYGQRLAQICQGETKVFFGENGEMEKPKNALKIFFCSINLIVPYAEKKPVWHLPVRYTQVHEK